MRIEISIQRRNLAASAIRSIYQRATCTGPTSEQIREDVARAKEGLKGCPGWVREHLDGYEQALRDNLYSLNLVFGGMYQGRFYSTHSRRDDYYGQHGIEASDFADDGKVTQRGHYWTGFSPVRPYFLSEVTSPRGS